MTDDRSETVHDGGCLCGQVRYRFRGEPLLTAVCHCRQCQRQSGSGFSVVCVVPAEAYQQTGATTVFQDRGDSGKPVDRHFCGRCGSPIVSLAESLPGATIIKAGTLDNPYAFRPTVEAYCARALTWMPAVPGSTRFSASNL